MLAVTVLLSPHGLVKLASILYQLRIKPPPPD
jgi:hypothetical protein